MNPLANSPAGYFPGNPFEGEGPCPECFPEIKYEWDKIEDEMYERMKDEDGKITEEQQREIDAAKEGFFELHKHCKFHS